MSTLMKWWQGAAIQAGILAGELKAAVRCHTLVTGIGNHRE